MRCAHSDNNTVFIKKNVYWKFCRKKEPNDIFKVKVRRSNNTS